jgi:hypothetical protein
MGNLGLVIDSLDVTFLETTPTGECEQVLSEMIMTRLPLTVVALIKPEETPFLQTLAVGGEMLTPEVRNRWANAVTLLNVYVTLSFSTDFQLTARLMQVWSYGG